MINLLNIYGNYNIIIDTLSLKNEYRLYVKEDLEAIVEKNSNLHVVFAIKEANMTAAFLNYLDLIINRNKDDRKNIIKKLERMVNELEEN
jgi:hypothetical protein